MSTLADLVRSLETLIPLRYAEPWDNVGLLVGDRRAAVRGVLVTVDLTAAVAEEAVRLGCDVVVAYHPPIFKAVSRLGPGDVVWEALSRGLAVWSPHTAFDAIDGGTNATVAALLGLQGVRPARPLLTEPGVGQGRVGSWTGDPPGLIPRVKEALGIDGVLIAGAVGSVRTVAVAAGSGGSLLDDAARAGADVLVVGEATHHDALRAERLGIGLIATLHSRIERPAVRALAGRLEVGVPVWMSEADVDPYRFA